MHSSTSLLRTGRGGFASALLSGFLIVGVAIASPAYAAGGGGGGGGGGDVRPKHTGSGAAPSGSNRTDLTTCEPGKVWDAKQHKCLSRRSGVLPDPELTEYAYALATADRYQEAIDVLDCSTTPIRHARSTTAATPPASSGEPTKASATI